MLQDVMNIINTAMAACSNWFVQIFNASGVSSVFFAFLVVILAIRFLLAPVFRGSNSGSDKARKSGEDDE